MGCGFHTLTHVSIFIYTHILVNFFWLLWTQKKFQNIFNAFSKSFISAEYFKLLLAN